MWIAVAVVLLIFGSCAEGRPHRILVDTDVDTDDFFALLYLLKLNTSQFKLEVSLLSNRCNASLPSSSLIIPEIIHLLLPNLNANSSSLPNYF